jgi:hypothetical protein
MIRAVVASLVAVLVASGAGAKDLCFELQGMHEKSVLVLKTGKLGKGAFGPVHGYFGSYDVGVTNVFVDFSAVDGSALSSSEGGVVIGLILHEATLHAAGGQAALDSFDVINIACAPGPDGKLGLGDSCDARVFTAPDAAVVVSCKDVPKLP